MPRKSTKPPVDREKPLLLEVEPFVDWLKARLPFYDNNIAKLADTIGLTPRRVECFLEGLPADKRCTDHTKVNIDIVDRAFIEDGSTVLWERFPHLYS